MDWKKKVLKTQETDMRTAMKVPIWMYANTLVDGVNGVNGVRAHWLD